MSGIRNWFKTILERNFADPNLLSLLATLIVALLVIEFFGKILMPIFVSIVIAYLLLTIVRGLKALRCPHNLAVLLTYLIFIGLVVLCLVMLIPAIWKQLSNFLNALPRLNDEMIRVVAALKAHYPKLLGKVNVAQLVSSLNSHVAMMGRVILSYSVNSIMSLLQIVLYFILVPVMVFFFLKDSQQISHQFASFLPKDRSLMLQVWAKVNKQIAAYIRGRVLEIIIISILSVATFSLFGLPYALILGLLVGFSVIIPYVGAVVSTIPVVLVALFAWGFGHQFWYLMIAYFAIVAIDANVLVPYLFAEVMNLHALVVIVSVLIFGGIWGFWGVFFAIPLAGLVKAVIDAWPHQSE